MSLMAAQLMKLKQHLTTHQGVSERERILTKACKDSTWLYLGWYGVWPCKRCMAMNCCSCVGMLGALSPTVGW
jgi:hypothetical protein